MNTQEEEQLQDCMDAKGARWVVIALSVLFLAVGVMGFKYLMAHKVVAKKVDAGEAVPVVKTVEAEELDFSPTLVMQGVVVPEAQTRIVSEVAGPVTFISSLLKKGEIIEKGELIATVDDADYQVRLANAESALADAELALALEKARAVQALRDWRKLGNGKPPSELVQRKPQIRSAIARLKAAQAAQMKALRDLQKTHIKAPYRCQVDKKYIDAGAYLSVMSPVADVVSVGGCEVRLPVPLDEVGMLPEGGAGKKGLGLEVNVSAVIGGKRYQWHGKVSRFEGGIDQKTFSMMMVVSLNPASGLGDFPLPPRGLFVDAEVMGKTLQKVVKIPRLGMREGSTVWVMVDHKLSIRKVEVVRQEKAFIYLRSGVAAGEQVIVSPLAAPLEGMKLMELAAESEAQTQQ